ncbi:MAG TPA: serine hydrolase, partial [Candidatus Nanopelagicales bacterium]|nr:serine hydrolase [Candidatus Nanopelagicales bacterium]
MDADEVRSRLDGATRGRPFSGVVLVEQGDLRVVEGYGAADRRSGAPNEATTQLGIASGTKTVTALVVLSLVQDGLLALGTPARDLLGADLPLIDDRVSVEHLLRHRSGIGDYLDESLFDDIASFELPVPAQRLSATGAYLEVLDGYPMVSEPGEKFAYNNGGYVVLALLAERAAGASFYDLVHGRVCQPAGLTSTAFLRSDALP